MSATKQELPSTVLLWIYEDDERFDLYNEGFSTGDTAALEEGIDSVCELKQGSYNLEDTGEGGKYFEVEIVCDTTEEGAGHLCCKDGMTGEPCPIPKRWYEKFMNKYVVLNDPLMMDPLLTVYSNPWKHRVEVLFTEEGASPPPKSRKTEEQLQATNEDTKAILQTLKNMEAIGAVTTKNSFQMRNLLADLVRAVKRQ